MNPLADFFAAGGCLTVRGDKLRYRMPKVDPELLEALRAEKASLLPLLRLREAACAGLNIEPLRLAATLAPEDIEALIGGRESPNTLRAYAEAVAIRQLRERGEAPSYYTAWTTCRGCGSVPIFEGVPDQVDGRPWCWNRLRGLPFPQARRKGYR